MLGRPHQVAGEGVLQVARLTDDGVVLAVVAAVFTVAARRPARVAATDVGRRCRRHCRLRRDVVIDAVNEARHRLVLQSQP